MMISSVKYRGFDIKMTKTEGGYCYCVFKDAILFSKLYLISIMVAKKCIDTYFNHGGIEQKEPVKSYYKEEHQPPKTPIVREVYLSEHEKYIQNLLSENNEQT